MNDLELQKKIELARSVGNKPFSELDVKFSSLGEAVCAQAMQQNEKPFIIYYDEQTSREEISYMQFAHLVGRTMSYLSHKGILQGDRVAIWGHNHWENVVQYFALWCMGATAVPINVGEDDSRNSFIIENANVKFAFVRDEYLSRVIEIQKKCDTLKELCVCGLQANGYDWFSDVLANVDANIQPPIMKLQSQECMIVYTSGTTGNPKGVLLEQGNLLADAKGISEWHAIDSNTIMMCVLPIHHVNGTVVTLATPMYAGATVVLNRKFQTSNFFEKIEREKVNIVSVVPTLLAFLVEGNIDISGYDLSKFRHIICGAGPLTCELVAKFEQRYNVPIIHGYGLSETTCYSCFLPINLTKAERHKWLTSYGFPSIGVAVPQNEMDIQNEEGESMNELERGEIVVRGHNVMKGYSTENANGQAFLNNWFRTGDEGFFKYDTNGAKYFFITGRLKELIIRGGVNLSPLEIDEVLNSHPQVRAGIAVAFDNDIYGEEVGALVSRCDSSLTEEALVSYCREHLPFSKTPKVIIFSNEIPVTSTGKYQRNKVKHLFKDYQSKQFKEK